MSPALLALHLALAAAGPANAPAGAARVPTGAEFRGTYRMKGTARVEAAPVISRSEDVYADAVLAPGRAPREVSVALASEARSCTLSARLGPGGELALDPGQRCAVKLDGPDARGAVDARLRSGRGRVLDGRLSLELAFDVSGRVALRTGGGRYEVLGNVVDVPSAWAPEVPLSGRATATVEGWRDESRAGGG